MKPIDPRVSMYLNVVVAMLGVLVGATASLTTLFGGGTANVIVTTSGLAVALISACNGVLHGYSAPQGGPMVRK